MEEKNNKNNSKIKPPGLLQACRRRDVASAAALYGCSGKNNRSDSESAALGEIPTDKMVYRTNPTTATGYPYWATAACAGYPEAG